MCAVVFKVFAVLLCVVLSCTAELTAQQCEEITKPLPAAQLGTVSEKNTLCRGQICPFLFTVFDGNKRICL